MRQKQTRRDQNHKTLEMGELFISHTSKTFQMMECQKHGHRKDRVAMATKSGNKAGSQLLWCQGYLSLQNCAHERNLGFCDCNV